MGLHKNFILAWFVGFIENISEACHQQEYTYIFQDVILNDGKANMPSKVYTSIIINSC
jgi:hypothetical protein